MYQYKVSIEIIVIHNGVEREIKRLVTVDVEHREECLLKAFFEVQNNYHVTNIMSVKITDWKEISDD